ncbi:MAG: hypothetical protein ACRDZ4_22535, partial [Egibacteraceae bacterium]
ACPALPRHYQGGQMASPAALARGLIARALDLLDPCDDDPETLAYLLADALEVLDIPYHTVADRWTSSS